MTKLLADHLKNDQRLPANGDAGAVEPRRPGDDALCNALFLSETDSACNQTAVTGIAIRQFIAENLATIDAVMLMARFMSRMALSRCASARAWPGIVMSSAV